ncbi:MAG: chorismate mutase [Bacteroidetes bacterium]|nr:chorismate mutase [Bacteroidota bacterium]
MGTIPINITDFFNNRNNERAKSSFIISGPCSAETEEQVLQTAQQLAATGKVNLFRAGVWKPRTRPGMFEGIGSAALPWLLQAKKNTGLPITVEVATAKQVEEALKFEVDVLWIGARTTVNPFSVQELADVLKGVGIPVLIKNPINPDIDLWQGAVERIEKAGVKEIGLIHRGFSSYGNTTYRNAPMWHLAIEMKSRNADKIFICDPSHIGGKRELLLEISQKSIDLGYDGLMIESHIAPDIAWSDAAQQITPEALNSLLSKLIWRKSNLNIEEQNELQKLRLQIDQLDDELLQILSKRMKIADAIGLYKKQNNITILQAARWNEILDRAFKKNSTLDLSVEFIKKYFEAVHLESIHHQNKVMNE